ncbi:MAG TPA: pyridoxine 5'-phosphate synthase [Candidatus Binatia bacterium]|jgi:pyridoxine 5-phosphate synthase|nr:pyridoxine 5'-phosphate synthase [Candidatus Binatia bacterium]
MVTLSVNVNKIATLRNARGGDRPNVVQAARTCIEAGCHGITVHPRPDGRHIRTQDVLDLAAMLTVEFNIEGYPSPEFLDLVCRVRPAQCTLVPDPPDVLTSNAGWNLKGEVARLDSVLRRLHDQGIRTSLFLEPDPEQVRRAKDVGTDRIELYTERYAKTFATPEQEPVFAMYHRAALTAQEVGLGLNAGHDLDLNNLPFFAQNIPGLLEVSIGHALICDALDMGLRQAVKAYLRALGHEAQ